MKRHKKLWSLLLVAAMVITVVPTIPVFAIPEETEAVVVEKTADILTYNCGGENGVVDWSGQAGNKSFNEVFQDNGNFSIVFEKAPQFPLEAQFTYNGESVTDIFDSPESTVSIGDHIISLTINVETEISEKDLSVKEKESVEDDLAEGDMLTYTIDDKKIVVRQFPKESEEAFQEDSSYTIVLHEGVSFPLEIPFVFNGEPIIKVFDTLDSTVSVGNYVIYLATGSKEDKATDLEKGAKNEDHLIYNCGNGPTTVVWISENGEEEIFQEDGSYTISLEDDAFFPYSVQFQYKDKTVIEVFDTPDDTVTIGGHEIRVQSHYNGDAISQIGVYIDGKYVAATPEEKTFSPGISTYSLLPLDRIYVNLDLLAYTPQELREVEVSAIIAGINANPGEDIPADAAIMWNYPYDENGNRLSDESFHPIGSGTVDFTKSYSEIEMIVGSGKQVDVNNKRYIVNVKKIDPSNLYFSLYKQQEDGSKINVRNSTSYGQNGTEYQIELRKGYSVDDQYLLGINNSSGPYTVNVYKGTFDSAESAESNPSANITDKIFSYSAEGYLANYKNPQSFTITYKLGDKTVQILNFTVQVIESKKQEIHDIIFDGFYDENGKFIYHYLDNHYDELTGIKTVYATLYDNDLPGNEYYAGFQYLSGDKIDNSKITKAVIGHYNSLEEAASQQDIKGILFAEDFSQPGTGYKAVYKNGVPFTIFVENGVFKYNVEVLENPSSSDTFFDITGVAGVPANNFYHMLRKDDSGAQQFGYLVCLVDDASFDLKAVKTEFQTSITGTEVFVGGHKQESGISSQNFSQGPILYTARAENGSDIHNYWVSFVDKSSGAKLFVVTDGTNKDEREIFFNNYTNKHHDIFIANVGTDKLTGLQVELQNAQHVKLDGYWQVGGIGNDSLEPFDSTTQNWNHEMSNIAKIRLLPDGDGEVSGKLVISSGNGGSYEILLKGYAGNPSIITTQLDDAVKYIPYSYLIQTNNKYEWNKVTFSLVSGNLPDGMMLRPSGELYGVPKKAGVYQFKVCANYSSSEFSSSIADLTLTVLENTDQNVADEIDSGYKILELIPNMITEIQDYNFTSEGSYNEFINFWLDGVKLVEGVDYDANEGSTVITIRSKTFQDHGNGTHTIASEFRVDGDINKELKRCAQNYTLDINRPSDDTPSNNGNSSEESEKKYPTEEVWNTNQENRNSGNMDTQQPSNLIDKAHKSTQMADPSSPKLIIRLKNVDFISLEELKNCASKAQKEGKTPSLIVDTMDPNKKNCVDVRIGINPALATKGFYFGASTNNKQATHTKSIFERYFVNSIPVVVSLNQKGSLGQTATICVKIPDGVKAEELSLYAYHAETNTYKHIQNPQAWIDQNHYLHFNTAIGGDIVVSVGEMIRGTGKNQGTNQTDPIEETQRAIRLADETMKQVTIALKGIDDISSATLQQIAELVQKEGKTPYLYVDSSVFQQNRVDVRVGIIPSQNSKNLSFAGSTENDQARKTKILFQKQFTNRVPLVVSLTQKEEFGQAANICAQVPENIQVDDLVFYQYIPETNSYSQIKYPSPWIDQNHYLHFRTSYGRNIVVSVGKLQRRISDNIDQID